MNAVNSLHVSPQRSIDWQPDRQVEPSMEEILASIRRIIADDQALPRLPAEPLSSPSSTLRDASRDQVFEAAPHDGESNLAAYGQVTAPQFPSPRGPAAGGPTGAHEADHSSEPGGDRPPKSLDLLEQPMRDAIAGDADQREARDLPIDAAAPALFSQATDASLSSAFNMLAATRLADDSEELRAMVRDMIRPLLKDWLDDNLPSLVERLVRAEIERVARGGR